MSNGLQPVRILPTIYEQDGGVEPKNVNDGVDDSDEEMTCLKKMQTGKVILCSHTHTKGP